MGVIMSERGKIKSLKSRVIPLFIDRVAFLHRNNLLRECEESSVPTFGDICLELQRAAEARPAQKPLPGCQAMKFSRLVHDPSDSNKYNSLRFC